MQIPLRRLPKAPQTSIHRTMSVVRTNAAAGMLGVSPNTLRSWERRFGFPRPRRTSGGHRQFELAEIEALRHAFEQTHNISSAISIARERGEGPASPVRLRSAFSRFDEPGADRVLEESLSVRSVERTVEEVLLPTLSTLRGNEAEASPEYGFAWRYSSGWLAAALRVAPPAHRDHGVVIFDASETGDMDTLYIQGLELCLRRVGLRTLTLSVALAPERLARALHAVSPSAVVLSGHRATMDSLARLVFAARRSTGQVEVFDFRGALPETGASMVTRLGPGPMAAQETLLESLDGIPARDSRPAREARRVKAAG
jgi:DNA-binding transcriptional MerR regulator